MQSLLLVLVLIALVWISHGWISPAPSRFLSSTRLEWRRSPKRGPLEGKHIPRKMKRNIRRVNAQNITSILTPEFDAYLKNNVTGEVRGRLLKTLRKAARSTNHPLDPNFGVTPKPPRPDLVSLISSNENLATFAQVVKVAEIAELAPGTLLTVLAPSNAAMAKVDPTELSEMLSDRDKAAMFVQPHLLTGVWAFKKLAEATEPVPSQSGKAWSIRFDKSERIVSIGDAEIEEKDIKASHGIAHIISSVLRP